MGEDRNKLFLPLEEEALGKKALAAACQSRLESIYVLCPMEGRSKWVTSQIDCDHILSVAHSAKGQSESIKIGVEQAVCDGARAVMIVLADQPFVTLEWMNRLIDEFEKGDAEFVASLFNDHPCPPAIFSQHFFSHLLQLNGDQGARSVFINNRHRGHFIRGEDPKLFFDVDTDADYRKALAYIKPS